MNSRISQIQPSLTLAIGSRAKTMKAEGRTVFGFAAGEPDFDTPQAIKQAAIDALERGETQYAPNRGLPSLIDAIVEKLQEENNLAYEKNQVLVSTGAKQSLFNIVMALVEEGDEVLLPTPYWLSYPEMVRVAGGTTIEVPGDVSRGLKVTPEELEAAVTPRTRLLILNSPCNPTGVVYSRDELAAFAEIACRHDLYVISDEIYEKLVYDETEQVSIGSLAANILGRTITVNGMSKAYAMTGWRLGYAAGPREVIAAAAALQSHSTSGANTFSQHGGLQALRCDPREIAAMHDCFAKRRTMMYERLLGMKRVTVVKPYGAFYMFPAFDAPGLGSVDFATRLLEEVGVAVVPGRVFGSRHDACFRISYACSEETICGGLDALGEFMAALETAPRR